MLVSGLLKRLETVLILVVVEDVLVLIMKSLNCKVTVVLILVVVEDVLVLSATRVSGQWV